MSAEFDNSTEQGLLFQLTMDQAPEAIIWIGPDAHCHRVNQTACRLLGYSREELESMTIHQICTDHLPSAWREEWAQLKMEKFRLFETHFRRKDGQSIPVEVSCKYVELQTKVYVSLFARDITERTEARAAIEKLRKHNDLILNAAGEGIFGLDVKGNHTFVNPAAARLLGYTVEELLGRHSHSLWHHTKPDGSPYPPEECLIYRAYHDGLIHHGEDELFWRKDGSSFPAQYTSTPIRGEYGELIGAVVTFQDITERKRMAAKLLEEAKLAEVSRVLGDVGHDIKNMLMPVLNGTKLLEEELQEIFPLVQAAAPKRIDASQNFTREVLDMIVNNARRIQDRVREIADAVKGATSPLRFAPCRTAAVVEGVYETLRLFATEKGVSLRAEGLDMLPAIEADERRLFNAIYNLVNNAIPEVPKGGTVTIRGKVLPGEGSVEISVTDTGRGMPPEIRDSLFTRQAISRKAGGTGLGTKIVKDAIDAHGGTISVTSAEGVGTTFQIILPVTRARVSP